MANAQTTNITEVERLVKQLKIDGFSMVRIMGNDECVRSRWTVDGYEWEICVYPERTASTPDSKSCVAIVRANLGCRITSTTKCVYQQKDMSGVFSRPRDSTPFLDFVTTDNLEKYEYLNGDSLTVQCTITVVKELFPASPAKEVPVPSSNLHENLGELLKSEMGADVTFLVCGESIAAHKLLLAARSPVFKAGFFGEMKEKLSHRVEVEGMEAPVFKAMLHFIYTDTVPELVQGLETAMAQHLLAAADRYGLDRLKMICENNLSAGLTVDTAATTLVLAERHNCLQLKDSCVEFIVSTSAVLDDVLASQGYKDLVASYPSMMPGLLN